MKRIICIILVLVLMVGSFTEVQATPSPVVPSDMVSKEYWSYDALTAAIDTGLLQGDSNRIRPSDKMTRAEMITVVLRALGLNGADNQALSAFMADIQTFADVPETAWFHDEIAMGYKLKLINGFSAGEMSPTGAVTREQAFTILGRLLLLGETNADTSVLRQFSDQDKISAWARPYIAAMVSGGYVSGSAGILNPGVTITREQFAQVMYNLFHRNYIGSQASADALSGRSMVGNLIVSAENITLANVYVKGDVIIGDGVGNGEATLDHVTIDGRLIVRGGGRNSIYLKNTTASTVIVQKFSDGGIRIHGDDNSPLDYVEIPDGKDSIIIECNISRLLLSHDNLDIVVNGSVRNLDISGDNISVSGNGSVGTATLDKGVRNVSIATDNTEIINHSEGNVSVVGKNGESDTVSPGMSVTVNHGATGGSVPTSQIKPTGWSIAFHANGGGTFESRSVASGDVMGDLPVPSKDNSIFIGWFTDDGTFKKGVAADTKIYSNLDLYACYVESKALVETDEQTMTSVMDVNPGYQITVRSSDAAMTADDIKKAIQLDTITEDVSQFGGISISGSAGIFTIAASGGYSPGCSYAITLNDDDLTFKDKSSLIRTYNVSVKSPDPVLNLQLDGSVKHIPVAEINSITQNGESVDSIFAPLYTVGSGNSVDTITGTFIFTGSQPLSVGDKLAVYKGIPPDERVKAVDYTDQPISYVTVSKITGGTVSYESTDSAEVIFKPDVLPVNEADDQDLDDDTVTISVDKMTYTGTDFAEMRLDASTTVDPGDFIAFYTGTLENAGSLTYAKIASVEIIDDDYLISIEEADVSDVMKSMDMSGSKTLDYKQLSENINIQDAEESIRQQVQDSGFAEAAADYLVALAEADDATREQICDMIGIEDFSVTKELSPALLRMDSAPQVDVSASISKNLKHFSGNGLRGEVTVTCEVMLGDDMKLTVSGTFIEEFKVDLSITSKTIWKYYWIFPYIADYQVSANLDLYNYTYLALNMSLYSEDEAWSDGLNIKDSIEALKDMTGGSKQINDKVQRFYELYQEMMSRDHDYFDLFSVKLCNLTGGIDPLHILAYGLKVEFVVSLDADVSLGTEFSYEKATRYTFTLKINAKTATTSKTTLVEEQYSFTAYAMGTLGIRAGIRITLEVGLLDVSLDSIGISAEVGAYWKIWGFVYYKLQYKNNVTTTESGGGCYMEIGIYLTVKFLAQVGSGKLVSYNKTLYDNSWPLWSAGSQYYTYDFGYTLTKDNDDIFLKGEETSQTIPSSNYKMERMDFKTGDISEQDCGPDSFTFSIKNDTYHAFSVSETGVISVTPPTDSDIAMATLEINWNESPLSFTSVPVSRTFNLVWDDLKESYMLNFNSNGGNVAGCMQMPYGMPIGLPQPARQGYMFDGWYTDNGTFTNKFPKPTPMPGPMTMPATNLTLYAKWTRGMSRYTVLYFKQTLDGSGYDLVDMADGNCLTETIVKPTVKSYEGFTSPAVQTVTVSGDNSTTVAYYYTRNSYTLTFILYDGMNPIVSKLKCGTAITPPSVFRAGYNLYAWKEKLTDIGYAAVAETMPPKDISYSAIWDMRGYGILYDLAGGKTTPSNANTQNWSVTTSETKLVNPTKALYIFAGWTGTGLTVPTLSVTIPAGSIGNRYYTATWK
jgi:uncharacterized repeat protein (TIGR02543 family)